MNQELLSLKWFLLLKEEINQPYFITLKDILRKEYKSYKVYPALQNIFKSLQLTPPEEVKVVLIGMDPYPHGDHADGLAFSSLQEETPYSLQRIFREVDRDIIKTKNIQEFKTIFPTNKLGNWSKKGILLLNPCLTVRAGQVGSHHDIGWQRFTTEILKILALDNKPKVFVALGSEAKKSITSIMEELKDTKHLVIETGHPASGAHGVDKFSGSNIFSKINHYFNKQGMETINWKLND